MSAPPEEELVDVKPKVALVINHEGQQCTVKVKANTLLKKVFDAAESRFNVPPGTLRFTFEGQRIQGHQTPGELEMEDGDQIDAHLGQTGGGRS
ncbi:hypothetical protein OBBRIDRAFT_601525 [Obba rivulosa]|uniref:Ubiquitin-like domain-containing protein n=1 Tax=Obba rivulosa TaxID=1052685 RepID=A0A8E2ATL1_9APHY|nr:hypothetical protein OBBRIDRAFT_601525 [Obba rivulosa]